MGVADYTKSDVVSFGRAIGNLINAVREDGVGADDFGALVGAVSTAGQAVNEMKDVPEAAVEHIIGAASDTLGDHALQVAIDAEAPPA